MTADTLLPARPLPSRKDEAWRYGDLAALKRVWPEVAPRLDAPERIAVPAGETQVRVIDTLGAVEGVGIAALDIEIGEGSRFDLFLLLGGPEYGRVEITARCAGDAHFELGGAILGAGDQTLEIVTRVIHAEPGGTSHQVVRSVLAGRATGSFLGKIKVARDAQKTDAEQSVKSMLLDRTATANAKPELEIYADDVKCAHGATVGELDRAAMFYMASRGLPPEVARRLMLQAFIADAFVSFTDDRARTAIEAKALGLLEAMQ